MLPKKFVLVVVVLLNVLGMTPFAMGVSDPFSPDPFATLTVWPYGTPEAAEGPIVTTSPADLVIYNNDNSHILDDVWLMLVINKEAFDHLNSISTNTSLSFLPDYFEEILGTEKPSYRIPPYTSDPGNTPSPPYAYRPNEWPGIEPNDQYNVGSLRTVLEVPSGQSMYYSVGDLDDSSGWDDDDPPGLNRGDPEYFTLTVDVGGFGGNWRVLVLALGHTDDYPEDPILNVHSPFTRSTLVVVSEPGTILLALASVSALGLYKIRHKIKRKRQAQES